MLGGKSCSGLVSHPGESSAMKTGISLAGWTTWIFFFFFEKQISLDCVLFCCKACRQQLGHERSVERNTRHSQVFVPTSSVATCQLACFEISPSTNRRKLERSLGKGRTQYKLVDDATALAQHYALYMYSDRASSFNQQQHMLYPNFIIKELNKVHYMLNIDGRNLIL